MDRPPLRPRLSTFSLLIEMCKHKTHTNKTNKLWKRAAINFHKSDWWIWSWHFHCHQKEMIEEEKNPCESTLFTHRYKKHNNSILLHTMPGECDQYCLEHTRNEKERMKCIRHQSTIFMFAYVYDVASYERNLIPSYSMSIVDMMIWGAKYYRRVFVVSHSMFYLHQPYCNGRCGRKKPPFH